MVVGSTTVELRRVRISHGNRPEHRAVVDRSADESTVVVPACPNSGPSMLAPNSDPAPAYIPPPSDDSIIRKDPIDSPESTIL